MTDQELLFLYLKLKSVFLCWQLQVPVCSDPLQVKFKQSLQFFAGPLLHNLYSLADLDCEQFCTGSAWSAVALHFPPHTAQGMQAGLHPAPFIAARCGEQHPKGNKRDPTVPSSWVQACGRSSVDILLNPSQAQVSNISLSWLQINHRVFLKNITVQSSVFALWDCF